MCIHPEGNESSAFNNERFIRSLNDLNFHTTKIIVIPVNTLHAGRDVHLYICRYCPFAYTRNGLFERTSRGGHHIFFIYRVISLGRKVNRAFPGIHGSLHLGLAVGSVGISRTVVIQICPL